MPVINIPNADLAELRKLDPDFDRFLKGDSPPEPVEKDATVSDVHVSSAGGGKKRTGKPATFAEIMEAGAPAAPVAKTFADMLAEVNDVTIDKAAARMLRPHPDGGAHVPFPYDANALSHIPPEQMRRFLGALTNQDDLEQRQLPMSSLVAVQPRVSPEKVAQMQSNGFDKLPTVVRFAGKNHIVDGNHRATAQWLDGDSRLDCKYLRLAGEDESLSKEDFGFHIVKKDADGIDWTFDFEIKKADADQQLIFGWASVVQEGDYLVVDHQGDMILPEDLEKGAYDFVLEARQHGDSHKTIGTGRLVESMVFTKEKQAALGVVIKNDAGDQVVGWWTGFKVDSPDVWAMHKRGERPEFSIGGRSSSLDMSEL